MEEEVRLVRGRCSWFWSFCWNGWLLLEFPRFLEIQSKPNKLHGCLTLVNTPFPKFNRLEMESTVCIFQNTSGNFNVQPRYSSLRKAIFLVLLQKCPCESSFVPTEAVKNLYLNLTVSYAPQLNTPPVFNSTWSIHFREQSSWLEYLGTHPAIFFHQFLCSPSV